MNLIRTNSENPDFLKLVHFLDEGLKITDGEDFEFYNQFNNLDLINNVIVAYIDSSSAGCGAFKMFDTETAEIKRMFVMNEQRGKGIAGSILSTLENWALEKGFKRCILETGEKQIEAIGLYQKCGYQRIPNYGQYAGVKTSICFEKKL